MASFALVAGDDLVLFDPLVPSDDEERFWRNLDADVEHHGAPKILLTIYWHDRSAATIAERYEGTEVWCASAAQPRPVDASASPRRSRRARRCRRGSRHARPSSRTEAVFWMPDDRALVLGDALLGDAGRRAGARQLVPGAPDARRSAREALRPLLELPVELVLADARRAGLENGRAALEQALRD